MKALLANCLVIYRTLSVSRSMNISKAQYITVPYYAEVIAAVKLAFLSKHCICIVAYTGCPKNLAHFLYGTNLKVGAPVRRESGGTNLPRKAGKICWLCPSTFLASKVQLVVFVSAFVMASTDWSVSCLLFYSRCPAWGVVGSIVTVLLQIFSWF